MWGEIADLRCAGLGRHAGRDCRFKVRRVGQACGVGRDGRFKGCGLGVQARRDCRFKVCELGQACGE